MNFGLMHVVLLAYNPAPVINVFSKRQYAFKTGRHYGNRGESETAIIVTVRDFAQIAQVLKDAAEDVASTCFIVDANRRCYIYNSVRNSLERHGELVYSVLTAETPPCSFVFGGQQYRYLEGGF